MLNVHISAMMEPIHQRRVRYEKDPGLLTDILAQGAKRAKVVARQTMEELYPAMGLLPLIR
jgi:tryptophanyl-tRNA synthetase